MNGKKGPALSYHSCVVAKCALYIWGGVYPVRDPMPDGCSKQLHVFDLSMCSLDNVNVTVWSLELERKRVELRRIVSGVAWACHQLDMSDPSPLL